MTKKSIISVLGLATIMATSAFTVQSCTTQNTVGDTTQVSVDYNGTYRGTLPCADCQGIKTTVYLSKDNTFRTITQYIGSETEDVDTGKFTWDKTGSIITLNGKEKAKYFVGENTLTKLNLDGKKVEGSLAKFYMLTKDNYAVLNKKWDLVELNGKKFDASQTTKKEAFIMFNDAENRYVASAGCNTISGSFMVNSYNHLELGEGMSTMMACPNLEWEQQLMEVLKTADTFSISGDELHLFKGRMRAMAVFKAGMQPR